MKFIVDDFEQPKAERVFVDRVEPRQAFWEAFTTAQGGLEEPLVLHYYGVGGIGKTSLHSQLEKELRERCPAAKYVELDFDFVERREPYRVMGLLKKKLSQAYGFQFPMFDVACYTFLCRIGEDGDRGEIESFVGGSQLLNFLCDAASMIPGASMVSGILKLVDEGVAVARNLFSNKKQVLRSLESMDIRQLRDQLPVYFAADLRGNLKKEKQPFVVFLDTYEKLVNEFAGVGEPLQSDLWLRGPGGLIPRLPNTLWVLGGREKLKWPQLDGPGAWGNVLRQYLLGALAESDAQEFLRCAGVEDPAARRRICALSDGLPVSLDLYVEQYLREGTVPDAVAPSALHERVVRYMPEEEKTACYLLAALGEWTQEQALAAAQSAGVPLSPTLLERLCGFSFVLTQDGVTFHLMRKVGEVLRQHCPASLTRALAAQKPASPQQPAPALDFDTAPEKYVGLTLGTFQEEGPCLEWVLEELDAPLAYMRGRLELDTYFAVIRLLKGWAAQTCPGGVLEALVDGYNGIGLYLAGRPDQSQSILEDALGRLRELGEARSLYATVTNYALMALLRMNVTDFLRNAEPLWDWFTSRGYGDFAAGTARWVAEAYSLIDQPQEIRLWSQRAFREGKPGPAGPRKPKDARLDEITGQLKERLQASAFSPEDREELAALVEEGRQRAIQLYGLDSREAFTWYLQAANVYSAMDDYDRGLEFIRQMLEMSESYFGEDSGGYGVLTLLDGLLRFLKAFGKQCRKLPSCIPSCAKAYPILKAHLGSQSSFTQQAYNLWQIADAESVSLGEYRERLHGVAAGLVNQEEMSASLLMSLLGHLDDLPRSLDEYGALDVMEQIFGGNAREEEPEEEPVLEEEPVPEEDGEEEPLTMAQVIQQLMEDCQPKDLYTAFTGIPDKKLRNALKSYADDPKGELGPYVLALYDATVMGNAKNGLLLFTSGVMYRESGSKQGEVLLEDLEPFTVPKENYLSLNAKGRPNLALFVALGAENTAQVLNVIVESLQSRE